MTVKSSPQKYVERINGRKIRKPDHRFKISPQILFIADIHKIEIEPENCGPLNSERLLYGQTFRRVMFYGRCELINTKCLNNIDNSLQIGQKESLKRQYRVDDGSANVVVHFNQATNSRFHGKTFKLSQNQHRIYFQPINNENSFFRKSITLFTMLY